MSNKCLKISESYQGIKTKGKTTGGNKIQRGSKWFKVITIRGLLILWVHRN